MRPSSKLVPCYRLKSTTGIPYSIIGWVVAKSCNRTEFGQTYGNSRIGADRICGKTETYGFSIPGLSTVIGSVSDEIGLIFAYWDEIYLNIKFATIELYFTIQCNSFTNLFA